MSNSGLSSRWPQRLLLLLLGSWMVWDSWVYIHYRWHLLDPLGTHLWYEGVEPITGFGLICFACRPRYWRN
jgi:hypothetical protein